MRVRQLLTVIALSSLAATFGATGAVSAAHAGEPAAPDWPLRVMSFNIHHGEGTDGTLDLSRIADVIRDSDAEVVGLQEVDRHWSDRSDFVDQASWLARELNMHVAFGANLDRDPLEPGEPRRQYGNAILTRWPVLERDNTYLPRFDGHEQRGLLRARIAVRGVPVQVYSTHLQHNDAEERLAQVRAIRSIIGAPEDSVLLLGDLNATPQAPEVETFIDGLVDVWAAAGTGDGATYTSADPTKRIDYVLTSDDVVARTAAVVTSDAPASDHLPVASTVALPGHAVGIGASR